MTQQINSCEIQEDKELTIDIKKIFYTVSNSKRLMVQTWSVVLLLFIGLTFIQQKTYTVSTDLYINKMNNSNIIDINPYAINEAAGNISLTGTDKTMNNELELMKSPLVIDKVIKDNDIRYGKLCGIIETKKTGKLMKAGHFLNKNVSFEIKKNTSIVEIKYKNKDRELAYNIVNSIITHYIDLHKQINAERSKSDIQILQKEYDRTKAGLDKKVQTASGLPETAIAGSGNISAMSAFSSSASKAISNIKGQYLAGTKSKIEIQEDSAKVAQLSTKLEWAKLVEQMSDSSKVIVLKEPQKPEEYEQSSPKLVTNILFGVVFGFIAALIALIIKELFSKKVSYSMLGNDIIYDINKEFAVLKSFILANTDKKIGLIYFKSLAASLTEKFKEFDNIEFIEADISKNFVEKLKNTDYIIIFAEINKTDADEYKLIKNMLVNLDKKIQKEVII